MPPNQLLLDFLSTDLSLTELARRHGLSLEQLIAWADSPETQRLFDDLTRISSRRSALIAAESSATALTNLAQLSLALARRAELANTPGWGGGPKPPSITALESSRKACATLLRLCPKASPARVPIERKRPSTNPSSPGRSEQPVSPPNTNAAAQSAAAQSTTADLFALLTATTDSPQRADLRSPPHPFTHSPPHPSRLATLAGAIPSSRPLSPSASRLSPLSPAGIPTG